MKLTLKQLKDSEQALAKLANSELPIKLAYRLSKMLKVVSEELGDLEETRKKLVQKYGTEKDGGVVVEEGNVKAFFEELSIVLEEEVDIPFDKISLDSLPDSVKLSPIEINSLSQFLTSEE